MGLRSFFSKIISIYGKLEKPEALITFYRIKLTIFIYLKFSNIYQLLLIRLDMIKASGFCTDRDLDYNRDIFVMDIDGNNQYPISKYNGDDYFPVLISK